MEESTINQPHVDDDAEAFFGEPEPTVDPGDFDADVQVEDEAADDAEWEAAAPPLLTPEQQAAEAAAYDQHHGAPLPRERASMQSDDDIELSDEERQVLEAANAEVPAEKKSGSLEREYIVFEKVVLGDKVLKRLLKAIEDGNAPEPQIAWLELHRCNARNVIGAVGEAYAEHQHKLGSKADLAGVSTRSFQIKHVEPKQVVASAISIT